MKRKGGRNSADYRGGRHRQEGREQKKEDVATSRREQDGQRIEGESYNKGREEGKRERIRLAKEVAQRVAKEETQR